MLLCKSTQSARLAAVRTYATKKPSGEWNALRKGMQFAGEARKEAPIASNFMPRFPATQSTYEPFDFSLEKKHAIKKEMQKTEKVDRFDSLGVNPLELWKSPMALQEFVTTNGKIIPGYALGLKGKNQKKLAKAIRRCRAAGLLSHVHRSVFEAS